LTKQEANCAGPPKHRTELALRAAGSFWLLFSLVLSGVYPDIRREASKRNEQNTTNHRRLKQQQDTTKSKYLLFKKTMIITEAGSKVRWPAKTPGSVSLAG